MKLHVIIKCSPLRSNEETVRCASHEKVVLLCPVISLKHLRRSYGRATIIQPSQLWVVLQVVKFESSTNAISALQIRGSMLVQWSPAHCKSRTQIATEDQGLTDKISPINTNARIWIHAFAWSTFAFLQARGHTESRRITFMNQEVMDITFLRQFERG